MAIRELTKANIETAGSAAYLEIESRIKHELGGWFDVQTERVITERHRLIRILQIPPILLARLHELRLFLGVALVL